MVYQETNKTKQKPPFEEREQATESDSGRTENLELTIREFNISMINMLMELMVMDNM